MLKADIDYKQISEPRMATVSIDEERPNEYTLKHLRPNTFYKIELRAKNELGYSQPELLVFKTNERGMN